MIGGDTSIWRVAKAAWKSLAPHFVFLVFITGVATIARTRHLSLPYFYSDEAFAWRLSTYSMRDMTVIAAGDTVPPLHYMLLKGAFAIAGDTELVSRLLSVVFGIASIVAVYALVYIGLDRDGIEKPLLASGARLSATLLALSPLQTISARTGRMYSLGVFLSISATVAVVWALGMSRASYRSWPWIVTGFVWSLLLYTHHFGLFTILAIWLAALCTFWKARVAPGVHIYAGQDDTAWLLSGLAKATLVSVLLYSPWICAAQSQVSRVQREFWIAATSAVEWRDTIVRLATGTDELPAAVCVAICVGMITALAYTFIRETFVLRTLQLQFVLPIGITFALSALLGRPLLQDRYLVFAQAAWIAVIGGWYVRLSNVLLRSCFAAVWLLMGTVSAYQFQVALPDNPPAMKRAAAFLQQRASARDLVLVPDLRQVNCVRFYLRMSPELTSRIRCTNAPAPSTGHVNHLASLSPLEFLYSDDPIPVEVNRLWVIGTGGQADEWTMSDGWRFASRMSFKGDGVYSPDIWVIEYHRERK